MALDMLQKFLGGNPQQKQDYQDFVQRQQDDPSSISDEEAARRYRELMRHAPQDLADEANQHGFGQVPDQDREKLAGKFEEANNNPAQPFNGYNYQDRQQAADPQNVGRMAQQAGDQDPDLFGQIFGKDSPLNSTVGKAALAGAAAYLASRVLSGQGGTSGGGLGGGLGGLGGLLGGQGQHTGGGQGGLFGGNQGGESSVHDDLGPGTRV